MALEGLTESIKEKFSELWSKVQESPAYNNLREKYETLSPGGQRGIIFGAIGAIVLVLILIPYSFFASASSSVGDYENTRELIRAFLRAARIASEASTLPSSLSTEELKARLQNDMASLNLLPEQMSGVIDLEANQIGTPLAEKSIQQAGVGVSLKKLNLSQIIAIGFQLQQMNPSVKLAGLEITAGSPDPHYFDVLYKLVTYSLPMALEPEEAVTAPGDKSGPSANAPQQKGNKSTKPNSKGAPPQFRKQAPKKEDVDE